MKLDTIHVFVADYSKLPVAAEIYGQVGVHRTVEGNGKGGIFLSTRYWSVSHIVSGTGIVEFRSKTKAREFAKLCALVDLDETWQRVESGDTSARKAPEVLKQFIRENDGYAFRCTYRPDHVQECS